MDQKNNQTRQTTAAVQNVLIPSRPPIAVTCPNCWTEQRSERNICMGCGAHFIYLDEKATTTTTSA